MKVIGHVVINEEVLKKEFVCNLNACQGACCKAGDAGAPLEQEEVEIIESEYNAIQEFIEPQGRETIEDQGRAIWNNGAFRTPLRKDNHCAYSVEDEQGRLSCGIEKAFESGATTLRKPISCHLYPIRVKKSGSFEHLNYDRWDICSAACSFGKEIKVPIYRFVKEAIIRRYGEEFFEKLEQ